MCDRSNLDRSTSVQLTIHLPEQSIESSIQKPAQMGGGSSPPPLPPPPPRLQRRPEKQQEQQPMHHPRRRRRRLAALAVVAVAAATTAAGVEAAFVPALEPAAALRIRPGGSSSSSSCCALAAAAASTSNDPQPAGGLRPRREPPPPPLPTALAAVGRLAALASLVLAGLLGPLPAPTAAAVGPASTREAVTLDYLSRNGGALNMGGGSQQQGIDYSCLLGRCGRELGEALLDPRGMHELACLVTCGPSDLACQMRCGDMYKEDVLQRFHTCAISKHQCVPQRVEAAATQAPDPSLLVPALDLKALAGEWYITHGVNPVMDCFPCQHHRALVEEADAARRQQPAITFDVTYRVPHPDGGFLRTFDRNLQQRFEQDPQHPGLIHARDFGYLKQEDDWYILAADPSSYMFVWYRGCNKAWCGYTGGVVYSRTPSLPPSALPVVKEAAAKVGVAFDKMCPTDNSCALQRRQEAATGPAAAAFLSPVGAGSIGTTGTLCRE